MIPLEPLWDHYRRLLKLRGAIVLLASQPFTTDLIQSCREWFRYTLVWDKRKGTNFLNAGFQPLKVHEDIVVFSPAASSFSKKGTMTYNPQKWESGRRVAVGKERKRGLMEFHSALPFDRDYDRSIRFPCSIITIPSLNASQDTPIEHATQKPDDLMEYLIRTYSNEGDTVLDNACGSATTLVACLNTNRRGIGIEKDPAIFAIAEERLARARLLRERPHAPVPCRNHAERSMPLFDGLEPGDAP